MSLAIQVLIAVLSGIAVGLFFGPLTEALKPIGEAYTMLLQMAVLPYLCFSLIHGLGSISPSTGKKLFKSSWPYLLFLWALIFAVVWLIMQLIPTPLAPLIRAHGSSDFTSTFTSNFLLNLIPKNPFYDIANNIAPAVAISGLIGGVALMHIEKKEPLISVLERINVTIEKILKWLGLLSPIAAFVYISIAFGTVYFEDLPKIAVYLIAFIATSLFFTFLILPTLLTHLTPLSFREASQTIRSICLIPFVTGLSTTVLPFLNIYLKQLAQKHETHANFRETSQTILPAAYSFGNIGNVMTLFFMIFLSFYYRHPFSGTETTLLSIMTIPLSIGASTTTVNSVLFLIEQLGLPKAASEFFLQIKPLTTHFQVLISSASVLTLLILSLYSYYGLLQIKTKKLATQLSLYLVLFAALVFSFRSIVHFHDNYQNLFLSHKITDVIKDPVPAKILTFAEKHALVDINHPPNTGTLKRILQSGTLRVGFNPASIPYSYYNIDHELVGFDIAYAYQLARDLDCKLEFVPFHFEHLATDLNNLSFDIGMSNIIMTEERILQMDFSSPYAEDDNVLMVPIHKKKEYLHLKDVIERKGLTMSAGGAQFPIAKRHFPNAQVVNEEAFDLFRAGKFETAFWSETNAFIWCITYPQFVTIDYGDLLGKTYFGYPMPPNATDFRFFINNWLILKEESGFKQQMRAYWMEGNPLHNRPPRWSILRNVLHFFD